MMPWNTSYVQETSVGFVTSGEKVVTGAAWKLLRPARAMRLPLVSFRKGLYLCCLLITGLKEWIIISMILLCDATVIKEDDRRRSGLPVVPLDIEYGYNIAKEYPLIHTT